MSFDDTLTVALSDIPVSLRVGVTDAERSAPQTVLVSIAIIVLEPVSFIDEPGLGATVDYTALLSFLQDDLPRFPPAELIETVAERVLRRIFETEAKAHRAEVTVRKPSVTPAPGAAFVSLVRVRALQ